MSAIEEKQPDNKLEASPEQAPPTTAQASPEQEIPAPIIDPVPAQIPGNSVHLAIPQTSVQLAPVQYEHVVVDYEEVPVGYTLEFKGWRKIEEGTPEFQQLWAQIQNNEIPVKQGSLIDQAPLNFAPAPALLPQAPLLPMQPMMYPAASGLIAQPPLLTQSVSITHQIVHQPMFQAAPPPLMMPRSYVYPNTLF